MCLPSFPDSLRTQRLPSRAWQEERAETAAPRRDMKGIECRFPGFRYIDSCSIFMCPRAAAGYGDDNNPL